MKSAIAFGLTIFVACAGCGVASSGDTGAGGGGNEDASGSSPSSGLDSGGSPTDGGADLADSALSQSPGAAGDSGSSIDATSTTPSGEDSGAIPPLPGWTLIWSDEFDGPDGSDVDPAKWIHDVGEGSDTTEGKWNPGNGWGNDELEYYTPGNANTQQHGGYLVISAVANTDPNFVCYFADSPNDENTTYHTGTCDYTSGRIKTVLGPAANQTGALRQNLFSHLYGRFEMRAQIPAGVGLWPAFWMMGTNLFSESWPTCGELDIMEEIGEQPGTVYGTSHSEKSGDDGVPHTFTLPGDAGLPDAFHVYAIEWGPTSITWLLDDTVYGTETAPAAPTVDDWPFDSPSNPFFIILNLAVSSGDANSWGAAPTAATPFPAQMKVDYVRVYEAANGDP